MFEWICIKNITQASPCICLEGDLSFHLSLYPLDRQQLTSGKTEKNSDWEEKASVLRIRLLFFSIS